MRILLRRRHAHAYGWLRNAKADSHGVHLRWRREGGWRHVRVALLQRNKPKPEQMRSLKHRTGRVIYRRTLTVVEVAFWRTDGGSNRRRTSSKGYVRLKATWPARFEDA